jgi:hypothetical protein
LQNGGMSKLNFCKKWINRLLLLNKNV